MPAKRTALHDAARSVAAWGLGAGLVLSVLGFVTDAALVRVRGSAGAHWFVSGLVAGALGALLGLSLAPLFALVHATARALSRSPALRRTAHVPVLLAAIAVGARLSRAHEREIARHPFAFEIIGAAFSIAIVSLSFLWPRASRWRARAAAIAAAVAAIAFDVVTPRSFYRDSHDLAAVFAAAALLVAARPLFDALSRARSIRLAAGVAALLLAAVAVVAAVDPRCPGWRAAAMRSGHYVPRIARAFRLLVDLDGDGYSPLAWGGDCDDLDAEQSPAARETTPGLDRNCNGIPLPARPTDADRGLAPPAGDPDLPRGAVDRLVLITIDCLRADAIRPDRTPRLAALAARGLSFSRMYAAGSQTAISLSLIQRGADAAPPVAQRLARRGVRTAAILSFDLPVVPELLRGFDVVQAVDAQTARWSAKEVTDRALAELSRGAGPRYLWAHYYDVHAPYPPGGERTRAAVLRAYDAQVAIVDREIGRLLDGLSDADRTAILVTTDHGEALGAHGVSFHGISTWEPVVRVPAIFVAPGVAPGTYDGLATHRDLAATILGAFGFVAAEPDVETFGRSFFRARAEPRPALHRFVVTRSFRVLTLLHGASIPQAAIVEGDLKLTKTFEDGLREMYDLRADPGEARDVEPLRAAEAARLERELELYRDLDGYP